MSEHTAGPWTCHVMTREVSIRTLQATNALNQVTIECQIGTIDALRKEVAELRATNAGLEKDAARYRWLRDNDGDGAISEPIQSMWANCKTEYPSAPEWDAAIDAALATSAGERKGEV